MNVPMRPRKRSRSSVLASIITCLVLACILCVFMPNRVRRSVALDITNTHSLSVTYVCEVTTETGQGERILLLVKPKTRASDYVYIPRNAAQLSITVWRSSKALPIAAIVNQPELVVYNSSVVVEEWSWLEFSGIDHGESSFTLQRNFGFLGGRKRP